MERARNRHDLVLMDFQVPETDDCLSQPFSIGNMRMILDRWLPEAAGENST